MCWQMRRTLLQLLPSDFEVTFFVGSHQRSSAQLELLLLLPWRSELPIFGNALESITTYRIRMLLRSLIITLTNTLRSIWKGNMDRMRVLVMLVAFLAVISTRAQAQPSEACAGIDCQQGICNPLSNDSYPSNILSPYQCKCNPGWQTVEGLVANLASVLTLPCTVPNCTLTLGCAGSPAPPVTPISTLQNVTSPCSLPGICGHGECQVTDWSIYPPMYKCNCTQGYYNVGSLTAGYCLKDCEVGSNCHAIGITVPSTSAGSSHSPLLGGLMAAVTTTLAFSLSQLL